MKGAASALRGAVCTGVKGGDDVSRLYATGSRTNDYLRQGTVVLATILTLVVNYLANTLPFNGQTTAAVSDRFQVYFVPAGYVFAIWGVIYLALLAYMVFQALPAQRDNPALRRTGWLYVLSAVLNSAWLFAWHYNLFPLSLLLMVSLLATLIAIYLLLRAGRAEVTAAEVWMVRVPFSIYLGWITVATIANATDVLYDLRWDGWGISGEVWAVILLAVATLITAVMLVTRKDIAYAAVIVWAFAGIAVKQSASPVVATSAIVAAVVVALLAVGSLLLPGRGARIRVGAARS
jgi:benzodiazapine receptor